MGGLEPDQQAACFHPVHCICPRSRQPCLRRKQAERLNTSCFLIWLGASAAELKMLLSQWYTRSLSLIPVLQKPGSHPKLQQMRCPSLSTEPAGSALLCVRPQQGPSAAYTVMERERMKPIATLGKEWALPHPGKVAMWSLQYGSPTIAINVWIFWASKKNSNTCLTPILSTKPLALFNLSKLCAA